MGFVEHSLKKQAQRERRCMSQCIKSINSTKSASLSTTIVKNQNNSSSTMNLSNILPTDSKMEKGKADSVENRNNSKLFPKHTTDIKKSHILWEIETLIKIRHIVSKRLNGYVKFLISNLCRV